MRPDINAHVDDACEGLRLKALARYELLDTPSEAAFERYSALAAGMLATPIAIISLVDRDRIWFKAGHGLDERQIGREPGLCASAILQKAPWIVEDASLDARARHNSLVTGRLGLRFYAGVPLRTHDGHNLGVLCVIDRQARTVTPADTVRLEQLAAIIMDRFEHRLLARQNAAEVTALTRQRELALKLTQAEAARRARAEADLKASEFRFRQWAEMSTDIRWETDDRLRFTVFEERGSPRLGLGAIGRTPWEHAQVDANEMSWSTLVDAMRAGQPFQGIELPIGRQDPDGLRWIRVSGRPVHDPEGRILGYIGTTIDATHEIRSGRELEIKASQQQGLALLGQTALQDVSIDALFKVACDTLTRTLLVSISAIFLPTPEGDTLTVRSSAGDLDGSLGPVPLGQATIAGTAFLSAEPVTVIDANIEMSVWRSRYGSRLGLHSAMAVGIGERSRRLGVVGVYSTMPRSFTRHDTTFLQSVAFVLSAAMERREAIASLSLRDRALEAVAQGIAITDASKPGMPVVYANRALETAAACKASELRGRSMREFFGAARFDNDIAPALASVGRFSGQAVATRPDGTTFPEDCTISKVVDEDGRTTHYVSTHADVTERLRLEADLRQAQTMDAIGKLTGGVAHDFNNLLTVVLGNAEILADRVDDPAMRAVAETVIEAAERGSDTVQRLLSFGRRQALQPEIVEANAVIRGLAALCHRTIGEDVAIRTRQSPSEVFIDVDRPQLETALLNLVINARDALTHGGTIGIEATPVRLEEGEGPAGLAPGSFVSIEVIDSGTGMSQEVLEVAFEPFFTTKEVGKGTGLGLSMVYGFVRQSGGHVRITSELGVGTTVHILLPTVEVARPLVDARHSGLLRTGHEHVLLVEDQDEVRNYVALQLKALGYKVCAVADASGALKEIRNEPGFDLLFTDVIMPGGVDGLELAAHAVRLRPNLKVLFTSGYSDRAVERRSDFIDGRARLLKKPYRRAELAQALRASFED